MPLSGSSKVVALMPVAGLGTLLTVAFIVLKLVGTITWSWVWVLAPFWIPIALWVTLIVGAIAIGIGTFVIVRFVMWRVRCKAAKDIEGKSCCHKSEGSCCSKREA